MKNFKRFLSIPIILMGMVFSCLAPQVKAADGSSGGYIDANWIGHHQVSFSKNGSVYDTDRNSDKWNGLGYVDEMWMTKDGQKFDPVYCYNAEMALPDKVGSGGTYYDRYGFFYGMAHRATDLGSDSKVEKIATALFIGYPNDGLNGYFDSLANESFNAIMRDSWYNDKVQKDTYTIQQFKQDVTQEVVWRIDTNGKHIDGVPAALVDASESLNPNTAITKIVARYGATLYNYAINNPLTESAADARNLQIVDKNGQKIDATNKLVADMNNGGFTQPFQVKGYTGAIHMTPDSDWEVYDIATNQKISNEQLMIGHSYRLKYVGSNMPGTSTINLKANYKTLSDSYFFQPRIKYNAAGKQWQNLVCLHTKDSATDIPATLSVKTKTTDVKFNKFEATGSKELAGAHMQVIDKATGQVIAKWESKTNGVDKTFKAEEGKDYILRETTAPNGYEVIADTNFKVTNGKIQLTGDKNVKVDGKDSNLVLINDQLKKETTKTTDVKFNKFEATGSKELAGAHMQVIDKATGQVIAKWESKANGVDKTFKAEEGKDYILRETTAPNGYEVIADTNFKVTNGKIQLTGDKNVKVDGKDSNLVLINDQLKKVVNTNKIRTKRNNTNKTIKSHAIKSGSNGFVNTGDNSNIFELIMLGLGSLVVLGVCANKRKSA